MRRLFSVVALTALAILVPGSVAMACEGHSPTATILLVANPVFTAGVLGAGVIAGLVRLVRR